MKKIALRSLTLATVLTSIGTASVYADEIAKTVTNSDAPKIDLTADVAGRYALYDSTRSTSLDFFSQTAHIGANISQGLFTAGIQAEFEGNTAGQSPTAQTGSGNNVGVRQAWIAFNAYKVEKHNVHGMFGRFVPNGANMYGPEVVTGQFSLSGFNPTDGLALNYEGEYNFGTVKAQAAIGSAIPVAIYNTRAFGMSGNVQHFNGSSSFNEYGGNQTKSKAYFLNASSNVKAGPGIVEAAASVSYQSEAVSSDLYTDSLGVNQTTAGNLVYVEASLGYNYKNNLKAGLWFSAAKISDQKLKSSAFVNADPSYDGAEVSPASTNYIIGLGVQGNSKLWGLTNILQKDDMLTYAAAYQRFADRSSAFAGDAASGVPATPEISNGNDVNMIALGVGYAKGIYTVGLNYALFGSNNDVFSDRSSDFSTTSTKEARGTKNGANLVYVNASVSI